MEQGTAKLFTAPERVRAPVSGTARVRLWDLPLRLFHWSLALLVLAAFVTAKVGGPWMAWHGRAGLAIVGLLAFRLVWGLIGSTHARFTSFVPTVGRVRAYLTGRWQGLGHNPLGALSVFAVLALLSVQVATGLLGNDDIDFEGPLASLVEKARSDSLTGLHHQLSNVLLVLIVVHVAAILFYLLFKKNNLVKPMVTGWKDVPSGDIRKLEHGSGASLAAFAIALAVALGAAWLANGGALHKDAPPPAPPATATANDGTAADPYPAPSKAASIPPTGAPSW